MLNHPAFDGLEAQLDRCFPHGMSRDNDILPVDENGQHHPELLYGADRALEELSGSLTRPSGRRLEGPGRSGNGREGRLQVVTATAMHGGNKPGLGMMARSVPGIFSLQLLFEIM